MRKALWIAFFLFAPAVATASPYLTLTDSGTGITETITVISSGPPQFELVFEAAFNWGLSQWYDLVNDTGAATNLAQVPAVNGVSAPCAYENGLQQIVYYGINDDKQSMYESSCTYPTQFRGMSILHNDPALIVLQSSGSPMNATPGIDTNIVTTQSYYIQPDGHIYVHQSIKALTAHDLGGGGGSDLFISDMGLFDPNQDGHIPPDTTGFIRAAADQNPFTYSGSSEPYVFAYWSPTTPAPNTNYTKASIMDVLSPTNPANLPESQIQHSWNCGTNCGVVRWGYRLSPGPNMSAGQALTYDFMLQLGTQNSAFLPNLTTVAVSSPIAYTFINNPVFPSYGGSPRSMTGAATIFGKGTMQ